MTLDELLAADRHASLSELNIDAIDRAWLAVEVEDEARRELKCAEIDAWQTVDDVLRCLETNND